MGTQAEHLAKAKSHRAFLDTIPDQFPDWLATVAFYTAVEYVEMLLATRGHHSKSHFDRKNALHRHFPNRPLNRAFSDLYNASLDGRYLSPAQCPTVQEVRTILIAQRLEHIEKYVTSHMPK